ncbi:hypothetical protein C8D88_102719 [Lentzea atacamensis]|uniref:DUF5753 domain-containing protein n=2 Tax=Lentzea TaxID=165301 RepID=A0A316IAG1_9PSEU|nr:hypothetical protein C8D88_102719 [Lentzea atacamensis]
MNVRGLIQLPDYTRALMIECEMVPADEVEARMTVRIQSHSVLDRPKPPRLLALIDEWVRRLRT